MDHIRLDNGVEMELISSGDEFLGIGAIRIGQTLLRSGRRPMFVQIRNPSAIELVRWRFVRSDATPAGTTLEFAARVREGGLMEWMAHSVRNRYNTADWTARPRPAEGVSLCMELRTVKRSVGRHKWMGFSYQYHYRSRGGAIPIYKILDRGTWEIGGRAVGNEIWMRSCFSPPIVRFNAAEDFYSSEWYLPGIANPNIFQFLPLQTELQGFTFAAANVGTLVTWPTDVAHVRTLIEKPRNCDEIIHLHEHCGDLGESLSTVPMEVLWCPGQRDRVARANQYEKIKEMVSDTLHAKLGMRRECVTTYGMIEEWGNPDFVRYREKGLPKLLDVGCKTIGLANNFQNNMNTYGVSNMCCTVNLKIAETVGQDKVRDFCRDAQKAGPRVEMWANTSISTLTWMFDNRNGAEQRVKFLPKEGSIMEALGKAEAPFVRNPSNAIEADHYTPVFAAMNLRDPAVRKYWLESWRRAHDEVGLGGIFLDSSFNLSSDKFHFVQWTSPAGQGATADQTHLLGHCRPAQEPPSAILSQYRAHLDLMVEMQKIGYQYCNEDLGVFGIHRHGPGIEKRLTSLSMWTDCLANFDVPAILKAGADPDDVFFRALAYRMMWMIYWDMNSDQLSFNYAGVRGDYDLPTAWHLSLIKAYNQVGNLMRNRTILPYEAGVIYQSDGVRVLWAFEDVELSLEGEARIRNVLDGGEQQGNKVTAGKRHVLRIETAQTQACSRSVVRGE